jgi:hypothetical protein
MMAEGIGHASDPPTMLFIDRCDNSRPGGDGLLEHRVRILGGQDHPNRSSSEDLGTGVGLVRDPEVRSPDREVSNDLAGVVLDTMELDRAEGGRVVVDRFRTSNAPTAMG